MEEFENEGMTKEDLHDELESRIDEEEFQARNPVEDDEPEESPESEQPRESPQPQRQANPVRTDIHQALTTWQREQAVLEAAYNSVNWNQLQQTNPSEYAALRTQFTERQAALQGQYHNIERAARQVEQAEQEEMANHYSKMLENEKRLLTAKIPSWNDTKVKTKEQAEIRKYAEGLGFKKEELDSLIDHRAVKVLRDAWLFQKSQKVKVKGPVQRKTKGEFRDKYARLNAKNNPDSIDALAARIQKLI